MESADGSTGNSHKEKWKNRRSSPSTKSNNWSLYNWISDK